MTRRPPEVFPFGLVVSCSTPTSPFSLGAPFGQSGIGSAAWTVAASNREVKNDFMARVKQKRGASAKENEICCCDDKRDGLFFPPT
jgi:hypothetical protein